MATRTFYKEIVIGSRPKEKKAVKQALLDRSNRACFVSVGDESLASGTTHNGGLGLSLRLLGLFHFGRRLHGDAGLVQISRKVHYL